MHNRWGICKVEMENGKQYIRWIADGVRGNPHGSSKQLTRGFNSAAIMLPRQTRKRARVRQNSRGERAAFAIAYSLGAQRSWPVQSPSASNDSFEFKTRTKR